MTSEEIFQRSTKASTALVYIGHTGQYSMKSTPLVNTIPETVSVWLRNEIFWYQCTILELPQLYIY